MDTQKSISDYKLYSTYLCFQILYKSKFHFRLGMFFDFCLFLQAILLLTATNKSIVAITLVIFVLTVMVKFLALTCILNVDDALFYYKLFRGFFLKYIESDEDVDDRKVSEDDKAFLKLLLGLIKNRNYGGQDIFTYPAYLAARAELGMTLENDDRLETLKLNKVERLAMWFIGEKINYTFIEDTYPLRKKQK